MITGFFVILTTAQVILGVVFMASPDNTGKSWLPEPTSYASEMLTIGPPFLSPTAIRLPEIKLEPYHICLFASNIKLESAYTSMSLSFDFCAFIAIVVSAYRSLSPSSVKMLKFTGVVGWKGHQ